MASKMFDFGSKSPLQRTTDGSDSSPSSPPAYDTDAERRSSVTAGYITGLQDTTHRGLKARHIQLIGIGGTIGTALYVRIGRGLLNGGPASLFIGLHYLFGFAAGWNFFLFEAVMVPFEITACNLITHFWSEAVPAGGIIAIIIVLYGIVNVTAVKWYGETEFWAALGKMLLIIGLILFTFTSMCGGNPINDAYGFHFWNNPGAFDWLYYENKTGYFLGFLQCLIQAGLTIAGPDYVSMAAGEAENPRVIMPKAYHAVFYRLTAFFVLGSLAVSIHVPHDDPALIAAFENGEPGAAASPYVIAMLRLKIRVLPHIVNALVLTSAFSAGLSYLYCSSRCLLGLAFEGKAPKMFSRTTRNGVPIYAVVFVLLISLLAFLQVAENTATVLSWFVSIITASQLINFACMCFTYIRWYNALAAQGISPNTLPYKGWFQPYAA